MDELAKISPLYEDQVKKEKEITKRYAMAVHVYYYASIKYIVFNSFSVCIPSVTL